MTRTGTIGILAALAFTGCGSGPADGTSTATAALGGVAGSAEAAAGRGRELRVMTRNLYLGASLDPVLGATDPASLAIGAAQLWGDVLASQIPARLAAVADEIAAEEPDLVGLQEVSLWRTQVPGDAIAGGTTPATHVDADFLAQLVAELAARGLRYEPVSVSQNIDVELPVPTGDPEVPWIDVRMTDRDAVLARATPELHVLDATDGRFEAAMRVPIAGDVANLLPIPRGWASVRAKYRGAFFRFVSAHLEVEAPPPFAAAQEAQAVELAAMLRDEVQPTILVGDLNSFADGSGTASYATIRGAGFDDLWLAAGDGPGFSCCQAGDLRNATSTLDHRIDLALFRGPWMPVAAELTGAEPLALPAGVRWASDHAGVAGELRLLALGRKSTGGLGVTSR